MRKSFLIACFLFIFYLPCFSQMHPDDSLRIASLKKKLPALTNSAKVDCLLDLATEYSNKGKLYWDSLQYYINEGRKLSTEISYKNGIANSILMQGNMEMFIKKDLYKANDLIISASKMAEEIKDNKLLGDSWSATGSLQSYKNDSVSYQSWKKAFKYYELAGDSQSVAALSAMLANNYFLRGKYNEAFAYCLLCIESSVRKPIRTPSQAIGWTTLAYRLMANMYRDAGEYEMAMDVLKKSLQIVETTHTWGWGEKELIGELFCKMGNADSALFYLTQGHSQKEIEGMPALSILVGEAFFLKRDYNQAKHYFLTATNKLSNSPLNWWISRGLLGLAKTYSATSNFDKAMKSGKEALHFANNNDSRVAKKDSYELISDLFYRVGKYDSAYNYLKKFMLLKDSILNQQFLWKLNNYKTQLEKTKEDAQIGFLNKDNQLKDQKLKQQTIVRNGLVGGIVLVLLSTLLLFRNLSLKRKKELAELQKKAAELESQALRAQMNPHFIFNCLSSINKFILKNESQTASDYLTRFSRLIRRVLTNSQLSMIPLSDEIEMLKLYLDMERLRFDDAFDYNIVYTNTIESETIYIPPMLLQPFCENAVWHGLMHKEGKGKLEIKMHIENGELHCTIADNGIGRPKASELKSKSEQRQKSFGLKITSERLAVFNNNKTSESYYRTDDVLDAQGNIAGTRVSLVIKFKDAIHELIKN